VRKTFFHVCVKCSSCLRQCKNYKKTNEFFQSYDHKCTATFFYELQCGFLATATAELAFKRSTFPKKCTGIQWLYQFSVYISVNFDHFSIPILSQVFWDFQTSGHPGITINSLQTAFCRIGTNCYWGGGGGNGRWESASTHTHTQRTLITHQVTEGHCSFPIWHNWTTPSKW